MPMHVVPHISAVARGPRAGDQANDQRRARTLIPGLNNVYQLRDYRSETQYPITSTIHWIVTDGPLKC